MKTANLAEVLFIYNRTPGHLDTWTDYWQNYVKVDESVIQNRNKLQESLHDIIDGYTDEQKQEIVARYKDVTF